MKSNENSVFKHPNPHLNIDIEYDNYGSPKYSIKQIIIIIFFYVYKITFFLLFFNSKRGKFV